MSFRFESELIVVMFMKSFSVEAEDCADVSLLPVVVVATAVPATLDEVAAAGVDTSGATAEFGFRTVAENG